MNGAPSKTPAVFLDRDGTLIREVGHLRRLDQMEILPRVPEAIRLLRARGFRLVVVTNQSVVARGWLTEAELGRIHEELNARLSRAGAALDAFYYCPHHPTEGTGAYTRDCDCRKPKAGLVLRAASELGLDLPMSYLVGDQEIDMELADRVGAIGVRIAAALGGGDARSKHLVAPDLWQAAKWIVKNLEPAPGRQRPS